MLRDGPQIAVERSMSCSCVDIDHDSLPSFIREQLVRARKQHYCGECRRVIEPGEEYEYVFGVWEGESNVHKTCSDCLSIRDEYFVENGSIRWFWMMLRGVLLKIFSMVTVFVSG